MMKIIKPVCIYKENAPLFILMNIIRAVQEGRLL